MADLGALCATLRASRAEQTDWRGEGEEAGLGSGPGGPAGRASGGGEGSGGKPHVARLACVPLLGELSTRSSGEGLSGNKFQVTKSCFLLMNHLSPFRSSMT